MLDILDILAVREVVAMQTPLRQDICDLLMHDCNQEEVAQRLGLRQQTVSYHILCLRRAFTKAGFHYSCGRRRNHGRLRVWRHPALAAGAVGSHFSRNRAL
jgi:hypothetical protein